MPSRIESCYIETNRNPNASIEISSFHFQVELASNRFVPHVSKIIFHHPFWRCTPHRPNWSWATFPSCGLPQSSRWSAVTILTSASPCRSWDVSQGSLCEINRIKDDWDIVLHVLCAYQECMWRMNSSCFYFTQLCFSSGFLHCMRRILI